MQRQKQRRKSSRQPIRRGYKVAWKKDNSEKPDGTCQRVNKAQERPYR